MSVDPANDWNLWKWVVGLIGSMLSGAAVGGWIARGMMEAIQQRVSVLERDQARCQATLKEDIGAIVKNAIDQHALHSSDHLQAIRTELAVLVALHGETQKDVQSIFERMDRRRLDFSSPTPHGERRDQ